MSSWGRATCPVCVRRIRLRKNGTIGAHKVTIYDGYGPPLRSVIGIVECVGTGLRPGDPSALELIQTCGWCHSKGPCRCPGRRQPKARCDDTDAIIDGALGAAAAHTGD